MQRKCEKFLLSNILVAIYSTIRSIIGWEFVIFIICIGDIMSCIYKPTWFSLAMRFSVTKFYEFFVSVLRATQVAQSSFHCYKKTCHNYVISFHSSPNIILSTLFLYPLLILNIHAFLFRQDTNMKIQGYNILNFKLNSEI